MTNYQDEAVSPSGIVVPNAQVTVFNTGLSSKPTIYSDAGTTPLTNPFQADAQGRFKFYAANGKYDVQVSGPGIVTQTKTDIQISDIQSSVNIGAITSIGGIPTIGNGVPLIVAKTDLTGQTAAIASTLLYTVTTPGFYRYTGYLVVTTAGNSVTVQLLVAFTDRDTGAATSALSGALNISNPPGFPLFVDVGANMGTGPILFNVTLSGGTGAGAYALHSRLELL